MQTNEHNEEWFLQKLDVEEPPVPEMIDAVRGLYEQGERGRADEWAELLFDVLRNREDTYNRLNLLKAWADNHDNTADSRLKCRQLAEETIGERNAETFLKNAGFDNGVLLSECVCRLSTLCSLAPGAYCVDKTWGFGIVSRTDNFYAKVTVDFDGKPGHQMAYSYAAERLRIVDGTHVLALRHSNPEEAARLVAEDQASLVKTALRTVGPLTVVELAELLTGPLVPAGEWKSFWDKARKGLKTDPEVHIPAKRNDPIRLKDAGDDFGDDWFRHLSVQTDPALIVEQCEAFAGSRDLSDIPESRLETIIDRLKFAVSGVTRSDPVTAARGALALDGITEHGGTALLGFADRDLLISALDGLPVKSGRRMLDRLAELDGARLAETLTGALPDIPVKVIGPAIDALYSSAGNDRCDTVLRELVASGRAGGSVICWLCANLETVVSRKIAEAGDVLLHVLDEICSDRSGAGLQARKQLRSAIEAREWIKRAFDLLKPEERRIFLTRVKNARMADASWHRTFMGRIVSLFPELKDILAEPADRGTDEPQRQKLTSWRSYEARKEDLRRLVEETIPENSREIAVARSYGDLRENFEYQTARDRQRLLLRRQEELDTALKEVHGTDFADMPTESAGRGTRVVVRRAGGVTEEYSILGEWDSEPALNIVPDQSGIALAVTGHKAGDRVMLTDGQGMEEECEIVEVTALSDAVREWLAGYNR